MNLCHQKLNDISANTASAQLSTLEQVGVALAESTVSNTVAVTTQSAINGESFKDASQNLARDILIGAASNLIAKEIGTTYKTSDKDGVDRTIQLASHGALGCASGAAGGGDCASGAVAGVVGELVTEMAMEHLNNKTLQENYDKRDNPLLTESQFAKNKQIAVELAGLAGGFSAIFTGNAVGLSDGEVADNIYSGQRIAKNAGQNNHLSESQLEQINEALAQGDLIKARLLRIKFSEGKFLTPDQKIKLETYFADKIDTQEFLKDLTYYDQITFLPTDQNDNPMAIGVHFDGTNNNAYRDKPLGKETNVSRMSDLYRNQDTSIYITGSGTSSSGSESSFDQATGLDYNDKTTKASRKLLEFYNPSNPKLMLLDVIGFSRGSATARGYVNDITANGISRNDQQIIPGEFIVTRSLLLYDTVASFGLAGNNINPGIDLSTPKDTVTIQAVAANEYRDNFDLDSITTSNGNYINDYSVQKTFLGNHSDIGGSYPKGEQGKANDIQFQTLNWMINEANNRIPQLTNKDGSKQIVYNQPTANQQPSPEFTNLYNNYEQALSNYNQNPTHQNQLNLQASEKIIIDNYVHKEKFTPINSPWNYDVEPGRETYYANDNYLQIDQRGLPIRLILEDNNQINYRDTNKIQNSIF